VNIIKAISITLAVILFVVTGCAKEEKTGPKAEPVEIVVAAAMSLREVMEEIGAVYTREHEDINLTFNFASSGVLQKQIEEGAPVDLFISAGETQMDVLEQSDLLLKGTRVDLLENELVLIASPGSSLEDFAALAGNGTAKICIGTPETVPAGNYASQVLPSLDLWETLKPKLVFARDVCQILTYVETGNVDAGIVYRTDAMADNKIKIITEAPAGTHKPAVYPMAVIKDSKNLEAASKVTAFLAGVRAAKIFEQHGFKHLQTN